MDLRFFIQSPPRNDLRTYINLKRDQHDLRNNIIPKEKHRNWNKVEDLRQIINFKKDLKNKEIS